MSDTFDISRALFDTISAADPAVGEILGLERDRQGSSICLIPSENYASRPVLYAMASAFANKYAEGYPYTWKEGDRQDKTGRYYQGQSAANPLETLAIERALELFTPNPAEYHANVQPHSGSPANLAVLNAFLEPGDNFLGLALQHGGHLTHGHQVSVTGKYYRAVQYHLGADEQLDYAEIERLAATHHPKLIFCGATAYPRTIHFDRLGDIAKRHGALLVADISHICGLCITGLHPHPFPHADIVTTTTHKMLRGPRGGLIVCKKAYGERIDKSVFPGLQGGPHLNTIAAMAVAFHLAGSADYRVYAEQILRNAKALATALTDRGFRLVGGGTDNHLLLVDVVNCRADLAVKSGSWLATRLERAGLVVNKNAIPGDTRPAVPSGIRLGTPAVTAIGFQEPHMLQIAAWIEQVCRNPDDLETLARIRGEVGELMATFSPPW